MQIDIIRSATKLKPERLSARVDSEVIPKPYLKIQLQLQTNFYYFNV